MNNLLGPHGQKPFIVWIGTPALIAGVVVILWQKQHPLDYVIWDAIAVAALILIAFVCLHHGGMGLLHFQDSKHDSQQRRLAPPPTLQSLPTTKVEEQKQVSVKRHPVKSLPPMKNRPFLGMGSSARPSASATATSSPQAVRTPSGQSADSDIADRRTAHVGQQIADGRTLEADSQREADKSKVRTFLRRYPAASVREVAAGVGMGKTKVGEIMQEVKKEGALQ